MWPAPCASRQKTSLRAGFCKCFYSLGLLALINTIRTCFPAVRLTPDFEPHLMTIVSIYLFPSCGLRFAPVLGGRAPKSAASLTDGWGLVVCLTAEELVLIHNF